MASPFSCSPGMGDNDRLRVPNASLQQETLAQGKVAHCEMESEGSYLEPDAINGMAYLEPIKEVFGN